LIEGAKFVVNVICKEGKILTLQIVPINQSNVNTVNQPWNSVGIEKWVEIFILAKNLSGMLSFEVIVDKYTNEVFGVDCKPSLHPSVMKFNHKSQMMELEKILRTALSNGQSTASYGKVTLKPGKEIFSFYQEIKNFAFRNKGLFEILETFRNGQDAVWSADDPIPFFALHYLQIPILFVQSIFNGQIWNTVDFCLEQEFLSYQE